MRAKKATALSSPFELEIELCLKIVNCKLLLSGVESERAPLQQSPPSVPPVQALHGEN